MHLSTLKTLDLSPKATSTVSHRLSSSLLTPRSPRYFPITMDNEDQIMISIRHLHQLLLQQVGHKQLVDVLRSASGTLMKRYKEFQYRDIELPKEIANLNRIKEDNERILKGRIKYLEDRLRKLGIQEKEIQMTRTSLQENEFSQLKAKLEKKNRQIGELVKEVKLLENELRLVNDNKHTLQTEKPKLIAIIQELQLTIKTQLQAKQLQKQKLKHIIIQTDHNQHFYSQTSTQPKLKVKKLALNHNTFNVNVCGDGQDQKNLKVNKLLEQVEALQMSNSALRRQIMQIHSYMDEQDIKYQKNIQKLQAKIQKLTEFNSSRPRSLAQVEFEALNSRFSTPSRRNSDLSSSLIFSKLEKQKPKIIKVADFNIKLQLSKNNSIQQVKGQQDTKMTLTSSQFYDDNK